MFTANEEMISHEPLLYTGPGTGVQFLNDFRMLPQFINGSEVPHQQEFMNNTVQGLEPDVLREETRVQQKMYNETQGAEVDINRDNAEMDSPVFMPRAESQNTRKSQQPNSNYAAVMPETVSMCNNPVVNEETLFTIIQSIKNLESLLNNVKSSILTAVESKLQEIKSTLVSAIDNAKTYSEAVLNNLSS